MLGFLTAGKIFSLLLAYRYAIFFPLAVAEGPIVTIIAGFLTSLGYFNFLVIYILAVVGDIVGDVIYYFIGRWGGRRIMERGRFLWLRAEEFTKIENHFFNHAGKTLLFGKWTHSVGAIILTAAGMSRMPLGKFVFYNTAGSIPKSLALMIVGFYFGRAYQQIDKYFGFGALIMLVIIIVVTAAYLLIRRTGKELKT